MLDGSENEVTGLLAQLFATEDSDTFQSDLYREAGPVGLSGPEAAPEMLAAIEKAKAQTRGTPAFSDAFGELVKTPNKSGRTTEDVIRGVLGQIVKNNEGTGQFSDADADTVFGTTLVKVASELDRFDPKIANFTTWVGTIARRSALDHIRDEKKHRGAVAIGGGGDDAGGGVDPARDYRLSATDRDTPKAIYSVDEEKLCKWLSKYFNDIIDGKQPPFFNAKMDRRSGEEDPEEVAALAQMSPEDRAKRLKEIERARLFAFMTHFGIGAKKVPFAQLSKLMNDVYHIPGFKPTHGNQWYPTLWKRLVDLVTAEAASIGIAIDPSTNKRDIEYPGRVLATFKAKLGTVMKHHGVKTGNTSCEDDLSNGLSDLLSVLESWHAAAHS